MESKNIKHGGLSQEECFVSNHSNPTGCNRKIRCKDVLQCIELINCSRLLCTYELCNLWIAVDCCAHMDCGVQMTKHAKLCFVSRFGVAGQVAAECLQCNFIMISIFDKGTSCTKVLVLLLTGAFGLGDFHYSFWSQSLNFLRQGYERQSAALKFYLVSFLTMLMCWPRWMAEICQKLTYISRN